MQKRMTLYCCALYVGWDSSCSVFRADSSHWPNVLVNDSVLKEAANDLQLLIDCLPPHGELILDVQKIAPKDVLFIEKSMTIRSGRSQAVRNKLRMKVEAKCPKAGCFEIRYCPQPANLFFLKFLQNVNHISHLPLGCKFFTSDRVLITILEAKLWFFWCQRLGSKPLVVQLATCQR